MGSGIGHWKAIGMVKRPELGNIAWLALHNDFLQALFEMGISFIIILGGYFYDVLKRIKDYSALPFIALVIICVNAMFNFPFHIGTTAMIAVIWLAILETSLNRRL
jgi:hypothetical protein